MATVPSVLQSVYADYVQKTVESKNAVDNNKRMIYFNENYRKKQTEYNMLLFYVLLAFFLFLVLVAIKRFFPLIPSRVIDLLIIIMFVIIFTYVVYKLYDIQRRYILNFDEIDIPSNVNLIDNKDPAAISDLTNKGKLSDLALSNTYCSGSTCCPTNYEFDKTYNKCVPKLIDMKIKYAETTGGNFNGMTKTACSTVSSGNTLVAHGDAGFYKIGGGADPYMYMPAKDRSSVASSAAGVKNLCYSSSGSDGGNTLDVVDSLSFIIKKDQCISANGLRQCGTVCIGANDPCPG